MWPDGGSNGRSKPGHHSIQGVCTSRTMSWQIWQTNSILLSEVAMRRSDLVQSPAEGSTPRTTQIVFGERQHLLRVLDSLETTAVPQARPNQERRETEAFIH